jgi:hypothetical protein
MVAQTEGAELIREKKNDKATTIYLERPVQQNT